MHRKHGVLHQPVAGLEIEMTTASEMLATSRNGTEVMLAAALSATATNQDWANESTIYTFGDGSVLVASGSQLNAYAGRVYPQYTVMADRDTGEWLGDAEFVDYVTRDDWNAKTDTDNAHFDTYEVNNETRAIEVVWTK